MQTYAMARIDEIDPQLDGCHRYRPVRHHLGIQSFGATAWVGAAAGDPILNDFDPIRDEPSLQALIGGSPAVGAPSHPETTHGN